jgi:hypothetical protein
MPEANALDPSPLMSAPVGQWLALQRAKNTAAGVGDDNLLNRVFSRGDPYYAPPPAPAAAGPVSHSLDGHVPFPAAVEPTPPPGAAGAAAAAGAGQDQQ